MKEDGEMVGWGVGVVVNWDLVCCSNVKIKKNPQWRRDGNPVPLGMGGLTPWR